MHLLLTILDYLQSILPNQMKRLLQDLVVGAFLQMYSAFT